MAAIKRLGTSNLNRNLIGLAIFFLTLYVIYTTGHIVSMFWVALFAYFYFIAFLDIFVDKVHLRPRTDLTTDQNANLKRAAIKMLGFWFMIGVMLTCYWLFPEYHHSKYQAIKPFLKSALGIILAFSPLYIYYVDRHMKHPTQDGNYQMGCLLLRRFDEVDRKTLGQYLLGWVVKIFFLPLMWLFLMHNINFIARFNFLEPYTLLRVYDFIFICIALIDLLPACVGYLFSLRILDTQIISVEPTFFGWLVAIMCYPPFWTVVFYHHYFAYQDNHHWHFWLSGLPWLQYTWAAGILIIFFIYALSTVCFGLRFSNLTYRGLITSGPYRFTKHPAYITKNITFWMIAMPFLSVEGVVPAIQHSLMLLGINFIYYLRAITEERHLSQYPEYVAYARWMNRYGLLRALADRVPILHYRKQRYLSNNTASELKHSL